MYIRIVGYSQRVVTELYTVISVLWWRYDAVKAPDLPSRDCGFDYWSFM